MRVKFRQSLFVSLFLNCVSFTALASNIPLGTYSYTQQGEELIDGQRASITWNIAIKDDKNAVVTISSWHALFNCDGKYTIAADGEELSLSWSGKDNKDTECDIPSPQIILKKSSEDKFLVRSELFIWDPKGWKYARLIR